jgi:hypothetical protein
MGAWSAAEVDHKRFLLDGLRQMYIIRVVNQANAKDRAKDRAKRPQSVAVASATRQTSSAPTKVSEFVCSVSCVAHFSLACARSWTSLKTKASSTRIWSSMTTDNSRRGVGSERTTGTQCRMYSLPAQ